MKKNLLIALITLPLFVLAQNVDKAEQLFIEGAKELFNNNNAAKAVKYTSKAIDIIDSSKYYNIRGLAYMRLNKPDDATSDFRKSIVLEPNKNLAYRYFGILNYEINEYDSSLVYLHKDLDENGDSFSSLLYLGYSYKEKEDDEKALEYLNKAGTIKPKNVDVMYNKARVYLDMEEYDKSHEEVEKIKKYYANADFVYKLEGDILRAEENYDEALTAYQKAYEIKPKSKYLDLQSTCYEMKKDFKNALKLVNKAYGVEPKIFYILHRATIYGQDYQYDLALSDFNKVLTKEPDNITAYLDRAYFVWFSKKEYDKAIEDLNKVIELDSTAAFAYNNKGFAYWRLGDNDKALELVNYSLELDTANSYAFKNLALIYDTLGDEEKAVENAKKAIELKYPFEEEDDPFEELLKKYNIEKEE